MAADARRRGRNVRGIGPGRAGRNRLEPHRFPRGSPRAVQRHPDGQRVDLAVQRQSADAIRRLLPIGRPAGNPQSLHGGISLRPAAGISHVLRKPPCRAKHARLAGHLRSPLRPGGLALASGRLRLATGGLRHPLAGSRSDAGPGRSHLLVWKTAAGTAACCSIATGTKRPCS